MLQASFLRLVPHSQKKKQVQCNAKLHMLRVPISWFLVLEFWADGMQLSPDRISYVTTKSTENVFIYCGHKYEGWNFNFGDTPLDWIQELLE